MDAEFWPVSAKSGENVQEFFARLAALSFSANVRDQLKREKSRNRHSIREKTIVRKFFLISRGVVGIDYRCENRKNKTFVESSGNVGVKR